MDSAIRTDYEKRMEKAFERAGVRAEIFMIYCFICGDDFGWYLRRRPNQCMQCGQRYSDYGQYAIPDFLLTDNTAGHVRRGIVRIDGKIHTKNQRKMMRDWHQVKAFDERGVKVFILTNEEIEDAEDYILESWAETIWKCMKDDHLYALYRSSGDTKERTAKPPR